MAPMNECIYKQCFASLILDYEFEGRDGLPPYCAGRVLIDGTFKTHISGETRDDLIKAFIDGTY